MFKPKPWKSRANRVLGLAWIFNLVSCTSFTQTAKNVDLDQFMGNWHVAAGRLTFFERNAFNPSESYTYDQVNKQIDVLFKFRDGSYTGPEKTFSQTAWVYNSDTNAHWKVSPFWPIKLDYLILAVDDINYEWAAVGVSNQAYLWILSRTPNLPESKINSILDQVDGMSYSIENVKILKHHSPSSNNHSE